MYRRLQQDLFHNTSFARERMKILTDIQSLQKPYPKLRPSNITQKPYHLVRIQGSIELQYQNQQNPITLNITLLPKFPSVQPLVKLDYKGSLSFSMGEHLNCDGTLKLSSIQNWDPQTSTIKDLVDNIQRFFNDNSPFCPERQDIPRDVPQQQYPSDQDVVPEVQTQVEHMLNHSNQQLMSATEKERKFQIQNCYRSAIEDGVKRLKGEIYKQEKEIQQMSNQYRENLEKIPEDIEQESAIASKKKTLEELAEYLSESFNNKDITVKEYGTCLKELYKDFFDEVVYSQLSG